MESGSERREDKDEDRAGRPSQHVAHHRFGSQAQIYTVEHSSAGPAHHRTGLPELHYLTSSHHGDPHDSLRVHHLFSCHRAIAGPPLKPSRAHGTRS